MPTQLIERINNITQTMEDFHFLFSGSLSLNSENIQNLDDIALERHLIAANQLNYHELMSLRREYFILTQQIEEEYVSSVAECDKTNATFYKNAQALLKKHENILEQMICLFRLLPELIVKKENR